jgi:hypothetical protein
MNAQQGSSDVQVNRTNLLVNHNHLYDWLVNDSGRSTQQMNKKNANQIICSG